MRQIKQTRWQSDCRACIVLSPEEFPSICLRTVEFLTDVEGNWEYFVPWQADIFEVTCQCLLKSGHLMVCVWVLFWTGLWFATDFSRGTLHFFEQCPLLVWIWSRCMGSRRATLARLWLSGFWRRTGVPLGWLPNRSDPAFWASGDAVDKGAGDIRVVKMLLALKRRYWSRATWVWR